MVDTIVATKLTKTYGPTVGIAELDLAVESGEVMGFLGTNGAGKSTTLRCLVGLLKPTGGDVRVLGLDPVANHVELMSKVGYLPGELRLYPDLTGRKHLEFLANLQKKATPKRQKLCSQLGLSERDLDRPVHDYSRGMKQKIGIIQAFQHEPEVVILDEPTEGLDPLVQEAFFEILDSVTAAGCTVLLSSHILSEVQKVCSRVAIVKDGHLVTVDSVEALRNARSRRLRIKFGVNVSPASIAVDEAWQPAWDGHELSLSVEPVQVVQILRDLLTHDVDDVVVEEAGLDEAVLAFYKQDGSG